jgi:hypothetical protein
MFAALGISQAPDASEGDEALGPQGAQGAFKYYTGRGKTVVQTLFLRVEGRSSNGASTASVSALSAVASERKIIWIRPETIAFKIRRDHGLHANAILPGDWDLNRALVAETKKYQSISEHFRDGRPWEETALFRGYSKRFGRGEIVRGASNLSRLKRQYESRVEAVFQDLAASGFRIARDLLGRPTNLPHVHIGRTGEILYGSKGNHRLAMAKLLSLGVIPCHVRARHADWQKIREAVLRAVVLPKDGAAPSSAPSEFIGHPDLADLYYPNQ